MGRARNPRLSRKEEQGHSVWRIGWHSRLLQRRMEMMRVSERILGPLLQRGILPRRSGLTEPWEESFVFRYGEGGMTVLRTGRRGREKVDGSTISVI